MYWQGSTKRYFGNKEIAANQALADLEILCKGADHLKNDCDKFMLVDKKTRQEKAPYVKPPYVKSPHPKKSIHEVTVDEPKDKDEEVDIQYPSAEIDEYDEITS